MQCKSCVFSANPFESNNLNLCVCERLCWAVTEPQNQTREKEKKSTDESVSCFTINGTKVHFSVCHIVSIMWKSIYLQSGWLSCLQTKLHLLVLNCFNVFLLTLKSVCRCFLNKNTNDSHWKLLLFCSKISNICNHVFESSSVWLHLSCVFF